MVKTCTLLTKIAGVPGTFMSTVQKDSKENFTSNEPKSSNSGLPVGPNVSTSEHFSPKVTQNRTGMSKGVLLNKIAKSIFN